MLAWPFAVIFRQGFVHRRHLAHVGTDAVDSDTSNRAALRIGGELHVVGQPESAIFIARASGVCGSSRTLGQRPSTQTALLKPELLIARGHGDAEETATPVPSARRHL